MTEEECSAINDSIGELAKTVDAFRISIGDRLARVETKIDNEHALCPFREDIARARNNIERLTVVEAKVDAVKTSLHALEVTFAKSFIGAGAAGGGFLGGVGLIVYGVGRGAGWW